MALHVPVPGQEDEPCTKGFYHAGSAQSAHAALAIKREILEGEIMLDPKQFRLQIVRQTLEYLAPEIPYSRAAEDLIVGTAMQESRLTYLKQLGSGPALGLLQMEPATHHDIHDNYLAYRPDLDLKIIRLAARRWHGPVPPEEMIYNLAYAVAMTRVHYFRKSDPLPREGDVEAMALYWKEHYNSKLGKGTPEEFVKNYELVKRS